MVVEELPLREDVYLARRTADVQHTAGRVRRDLTSGLVLGLPYRLLVRATFLFVVPRLKLSLQLLSTKHRKLITIRNDYNKLYIMSTIVFI